MALSRLAAHLVGLLLGLALVAAPASAASSTTDRFGEPSFAGHGGGAAPLAARAGAVSGTLGDAADFALTYTISGADFALKPGTTSSYTATYPGSGAITISGSMTITRAQGYVSSVQMLASVGDASWSWPAGGGYQDVSGQTVTQTFTVSQVPTQSNYAFGHMAGGASIWVCGGVCAKQVVSFDVLLPAAPAPTPTPAPTTVPSTDTEPPRVRAIPIGTILQIGHRYRQHYTVTDNSRKAYVYATLYDSGTKIGSAASKGLMSANGFKEWVNVTPGSARKGPLEFCVWARDAAGNTSAKAPRGSCSWLDVRVPIKNVSNQCGGAGWDKVVEFQNYVGNTSTYYDAGTDDSYTVDFSDACNLHDAGYGGATVADVLDGRRGHRPTVNFRKWSRSEVDAKFLSDMQKICRREIPRKARSARVACVSGKARYYAVRAIGGWFFDADLRTPGIQSTGHRTNDGPLDAITWLP